MRLREPCVRPSRCRHHPARCPARLHAAASMMTRPAPPPPGCPGGPGANRWPTRHRGVLAHGRDGNAVAEGDITHRCGVNRFVVMVWASASLSSVFIWAAHTWFRHVRGIADFLQARNVTADSVRSSAPSEFANCASRAARQSRGRCRCLAQNPGDGELGRCSTFLPARRASEPISCRFCS